MVVRPINKPPWEFAANPYSIWVDNEGNQLPYISKITMGNVENLEVLGLRAAAGDYDFQDRHLGVKNLPVLVENERRAATRFTGRRPRRSTAGSGSTWPTTPTRSWAS